MEFRGLNMKQSRTGLPIIMTAFLVIAFILGACGERKRTRTRYR